MTSGRPVTKEQHDAILALCLKEGRNRNRVMTFTQIAEMFGVHTNTVRRVLRGKDRTEIERRLLNVWCGMRHRCNKPTGRGWENYHGRGIRVCDEWAVFENFKEWANKNGYSPGLQIDRIDNSGDYGPGNCRFVTRVQNMNNKRNNVLITAFGETKTAAEWSRDERCAVSQDRLVWRFRKWKGNAELAITKPPRRMRIRRKQKNST